MLCRMAIGVLSVTSFQYNNQVSSLHSHRHSEQYRTTTDEPHWIPVKDVTAADVQTVLLSIVNKNKSNVNVARSHAHTVVWECCKDDRQSQWGMAKFDPQLTQNP